MTDHYSKHPPAEQFLAAIVESAESNDWLLIEHWEDRTILEFGIGDECTVHIPPGSPVVYFSAPVRPLYDCSSDQLCRQLLQWNLHGSHTNGCVLALSEEGRTILLSYQRPLEGIVPERAIALLKKFCTAVSEVRGRIADWEAGHHYGESQEKHMTTAYRV